MCNHVFKPLWYVCDDDYGITTNKIHLENDNKGHLAYCTKCGQVFVREIAEKMWVCEVKKMSDLISRQAAIDELKRISFSRWFECGEYLTEDTREIEIINSNKALEVIEALPSADVPDINAGDMVSRHAVSSWLKQYGQDVLHGKYKFSLMYIWKNLMDLPSAQPEIVYCKDCKHADYSGCKNGNIYCLEHGMYINESDFCSRGEEDE